MFVLTNSTAARRFVLTNPDDYSLTYNGLVLALDKRRSNGWQAFGSYTFSRTSGLQASSGSRCRRRAAQHGRAEHTFGRDPNNLTNARAVCRTIGRTSSASWARWKCLEPASSFAANLQHFSGKPWAATAQVSLPQGDQRILLEPRGSRRLSSQSLLDLRVSRTLGSEPGGSSCCSTCSMF